MAIKGFEVYTDKDKFFPPRFNTGITIKDKELLHAKIFYPDLSQHWKETVSRNIATTIEYVEDLAELKDKVSKLSLTLESVKKEVVSCRECIDELCIELTDRPTIKNTQLFDLGEGLKLFQTIPIIIEETKEEVIASFPEVELFSVGSGEAETINKLKKAIAELYFELAATPDEQLGRVPQSWKRILNKVIKRDG